VKYYESIALLYYFIAASPTQTEEAIVPQSSRRWKHSVKKEERKIIKQETRKPKTSLTLTKGDTCPV